MSVGTRVRRLLGPFEPPVARAYRQFFYRPESLVPHLQGRCTPLDVLEIGCGEGLLTDVLAAAFPAARFTGIDIAGTPGRLYGRDPSRATFLMESASALAARTPGRFDLVVVSDVMHHVALHERKGLLRDAARAARPGALLVLKDWERRPSLVHALNWFSDRVISSSWASYLTVAELEALVMGALPGARILACPRLRPWVNNFALVVQFGELIT